MKKRNFDFWKAEQQGSVYIRVLDYLMEKDLYFLPCHGVFSAGTCNGVNYVSRQGERTKKCMIHQEDEYDYLWNTILLKKKSPA